MPEVSEPNLSGEPKEIQESSVAEQLKAQGLSDMDIAKMLSMADDSSSLNNQKPKRSLSDADVVQGCAPKPSEIVKVDKYLNFEPLEHFMNIVTGSDFAM